MKPPVTPPYLLMCFYAVCGLAALYDLWTDYAVSGGARWGMVALDAVQLCALSLLVWLAGTYPLQAIWPVQNVGRPSEVRE